MSAAWARRHAALRAHFAAHPHVADIRGRGLFLALSSWPIARARLFAPAAVRRPVETCRPEHGLAVYPSSGTIDGRSGDHG
jgi:hypothetical protein